MQPHLRFSVVRKDVANK